MWNFFLIVKTIQLIGKIIIYLICVLYYIAELLYGVS
nr:MAG TPA: hypothetical protein [Bacteriophage sp.]